ncbi:MAG: mannose-1-phosphate guanylyltransferase/mannose-6-phosphate isomerase [Gammaproteobacteria bacterium]|nr:MAG: mannose-1-phosphate guanylyltransferase/mannose-6-phosphate isomerase [Gammaproteobacteria bacterium]
MIPVIMSGGSGTRLWPLSRQNKPKQFLNLFGEHSLFQDTLNRLSGLDKLEAPIVVCNVEHRFMVAEQLQQLAVSDAEIVLEPCARNTAPAIAIAAMQAQLSGNDPIMLVLAADHIIHDEQAFHNAIKQAKIVAEQGALVTFGIVPDSPHTGYGYIEAADKGVCSQVRAFVEKPNKNKAEQYIESGNYYWNSGMFIFKASTILDELKIFAPEIFKCCEQAINQSSNDLDFIRLDAELFSQCPSDSLDYAVMEKTDKAVVIPLDAGWSDVGSWSSLWDNQKKDKQNNVRIGDVFLEQVSNSYIHSEQRLVTVLGVDNLVVVETPDAVMIADKNHAENIKVLVSALKEDHRDEATMHRKGYRPWGHYDSIDKGERFQVKRITVNPGASLSLQLHHHRAEHWIVVKGTAEVTCGDTITLLSENESTFIPLGTKHRLHNPGQLPLEIIEIQSGDYLGEDDIVRFDDEYNRG